MIRRMTPLVAALLALFALQFGDCLSPISADQQTMQCCGSMPCNPTNHSHNCCKTMVSSPSPSLLPAKHFVAHVPVTAVVHHLSVSELLVFTDVTPAEFKAPHPSPPELYPRHSSLLI